VDAIFLGHFELQAERLKNASQAFRIIEEARGRSIADALRFRVADQPLRSASLTATEKEISRLQLKLINAKPTERKRLLEELFTLEQRVGLVEAGTRPPRLQKPHQPLPLARVQAALGPDEVLLEYVVDEPLSHCLAIERSRTRIFTLPARSQIEKQVNEVAESLNKQTSNFEATAAQLYESIVSPAAAAVSSKAHVVIVADGPLYDLPFEMLGPRQSAPLLMSHVVTYAPSATVYTMLSEDKPSGTTLPVLAVGTGSDTPGPDKNGPAAAGGKPFGTINREVFDTDSGQLIPLAAANGETRLVADALGPGGVLLTGTAASEGALKKQPLDSVSSAPLRCPRISEHEIPERSALVLYPDAAAGEDGYWQAREVGRTKLNAELVTLSACDVGSGRLVGQEGVANLVRPFLMAGARTVVANL
jgi:CHAT domain-containing protein